jgi:hypothetical protein
MFHFLSLSFCFNKTTVTNPIRSFVFPFEPLPQRPAHRYSYEQVKEERDKLRLSIMEANNRADMLAQEVDENHAKLEQSTQSKLM